MGLSNTYFFKANYFFRIRPQYTALMVESARTEIDEIDISRATIRKSASSLKDKKDIKMSLIFYVYLCGSRI